MDRYWVWEYGLFEKNPKRVDSLTPETTLEVVKLADAQATVEALQRERDEANLYRDQARANQESLAACVDRDVRKIKDLQAALDAEREKVKGLHEVTKVICAHCCEPMEIPSKAVLQTQLTQLQALVRALPMPEEGGFPIVEVDGDYYVNHTSRFSTKDEAEAYAKLLAYRATLDATTPAPIDAAETHDRMFNHTDRHPEAL